MKITKTQLRKIIKEEISKVVSEQEIGEGFISKAFRKVRRGVGHRTSGEATAEYHQKIQDEWDDMSSSEQRSLQNAYRSHEIGHDRVKIPKDIRDELLAKMTAADEEETARGAASSARAKKEYERQRAADRAADNKYYANRAKEWEEEEAKERYRKKRKGTPGSLDGEGSPSAPWDE